MFELGSESGEADCAEYSLVSLETAGEVVASLCDESLPPDSKSSSSSALASAPPHARTHAHTNATCTFFIGVLRCARFQSLPWALGVAQNSTSAQNWGTELMTVPIMNKAPTVS